MNNKIRMKIIIASKPMRSARASFTDCQIISAEIKFGLALVVLVIGWLKMNSALTVLTPINSIEIALRRMQSIPS